MHKCAKCGKNCEKEYCWKCAPRKPLKNSIWKIKAKQFNIIKDSVIPNGEGIYNNIKMREFFLEIWAKRKIHKCEMCGEWLGSEPLSYMFDHILEKSVYPELKFEEDNIAYLCLLCHDNKTRGFPSESYLQKINETKIKYNLK